MCSGLHGTCGKPWLLAHELDEHRRHHQRGDANDEPAGHELHIKAGLLCVVYTSSGQLRCPGAINCRARLDRTSLSLSRPYIVDVRL